VEINVNETVKKAYLVPGHTALDIVKSKDNISVIVPKFTCHTALVLEY
jgi:hypothetical protein